MSERAVVVGAGGISGAWFPALISENVQITAVVDINISAAEARIREFGLDSEASSDLSAMLERHQPDFVVDLTVPESHHSVTLTALRAGCHVLGEKPMAISMDQAREMVRVSEETGKLYMVDQSRRWEPKHDRIRRAVMERSIGDLTTLNCDFYIGAHFGGFRDEMASPLLLDMAIHHFDLARCLGGVDPVAVYAQEFNPRGSWYRGDAAANCIFEMSDGVVFAYRGSWCAEGCHTSWNGDWRIVGDRGTLMYERDQEPWGQVVSGDEGFHRPLEDARIPFSPMGKTSMHGALLEMLNYLRTGAIPQTECHDNIKSQAMVFAAIESSHKGEKVSIQAL